jgi:mRNA interferase MazF
MFKDFINWIQRKMFLHTQNRVIPFAEREIWWCDIGVNLGYEIDGKNQTFNRPVLIIRKFNHNQFWGIPLTSKIKKESELYFQINLKGKISYLCLSQMRVMDSKRLNNLISQMDESIFIQVKNKIVEIIQK